MMIMKLFRTLFSIKKLNSNGDGSSGCEADDFWMDIAVIAIIIMVMVVGMVSLQCYYGDGSYR